MTEKSGLTLATSDPASLQPLTTPQLDIGLKVQFQKTITAPSFVPSDISAPGVPSASLG